MPSFELYADSVKDMTYWALNTSDDVSQALGRLFTCKAMNIAHEFGGYLPLEKLAGNDVADFCRYDGATLKYYTEEIGIFQTITMSPLIIILQCKTM